MTPSGYVVREQDWPVGASDDDLTPRQVCEALATEDAYHDVAMESLKDT